MKIQTGLKRPGATYMNNNVFLDSINQGVS
jgi:hypothetical protein